MHTVHIIGPRPDFRVIIGLLYGDMHNVDTEGNSVPVHSRRWTSLYVKDRESDDPCVEIEARDDGATFEVISEDQRLEELAAFYLFRFCGDRIEVDGRPIEAEQVTALLTRYSVELARAEQSIWHRSSESVPYPNLLGDQGAAASWR
jgi:hypothetical protein